MKYISPLISDARNKLGGSVFARNRAGVYARALVKPAQPRTESQRAQRAQFGSLSAAWKGLSQAQIAGWNACAEQQFLTDTLGHRFRPSGLQLFVSCNRNLLAVGESQLNEPPAQGPPSFPVLPWTWFVAYLPGSVFLPAWRTYNVFPASNFQPLAYATPGLSPGISFIAPFRYRRLAPPYPYNTYAEIMDVTASYTATFPEAVLGSLVGGKYLLVDTATGYASAPVTATSIVFNG